MNLGGTVLRVSADVHGPDAGVGLVKESASSSHKAVAFPAVPGAAQPALLNLGQVVDAIMIGEGGTIRFYNLSILNAAPRGVLHTDTHARYRIKTFGPWPSITILPNATVSLA